MIKKAGGQFLTEQAGGEKKTAGVRGEGMKGFPL